MKLRWKILLGLLVLLLLIVTSLTLTMHVQPQNELETYKKLLRAQGEKLELSEIMPHPVPAESNALDAVEDAFHLYNSDPIKLPYAMQMVAPGKALIGWQQPDARNTDFTNSWAEFAGAVATDQPAIELLHVALERPKLDFQLDYKQGATLPLSHLAPLKKSAQKLDATVIFNLHNGDTGSATTNTLTILALVRDNIDEGLLISHLVRVAIASIAISPTWEVLQATNTTDTQLAALQRGWTELEFLNETENSMIFERAWSIRELERIRASHEAFTGIYSGMSGSGMYSSSSGGSGWPDSLEEATEGIRTAIGEGLWRMSWSYSDELKQIQSDQMILDAVRAMQTNHNQFYKADYDVMSTHLATLNITNSGSALLRTLEIPDFREFFNFSPASTIRKTLLIETSRRVVITAVALKRFQLRHGHWPGTLNELTPEFLTAVPIDPYDGKPLKYHPNPDATYLLYSVGEDGVDDGGDATNTATGTSLYWQNAKARDWVWPQPATPAEVQFFYEHPPTH